MTQKLAFFCALAMAAVLPVPGARAGSNQCDPGEAPDIIVGDIFDMQRYGVVGDITGFAIGTESCNVGSCWADWISGTPFHPVIGQNMHRLKDGRFEQIGQSFVKHGFATLNGDLCGDCVNSDGQHLGVNCSDPYWAGLNGSQSSLGPRFEVNVETGEHLHPYTYQGQSGNAIYKRLQVHHSDLNPAENAGALYFVEGQYVLVDDAEVGKHTNNNSWRRAVVTGAPDSGNYSFNLSGAFPTVREQPAIYAWQANDPEVEIRRIQKEFVAGFKATDLGGGWWHYEYAIFNMLSHRSARSVSLPLPHGAQLANVGFHDVDYHSGEPYDGTDWEVTIVTGEGPNSITWSTDTYEQNEDANALRWGTLYNFRFDANVPPAQDVRGSLGLFRPGSPDEYVLTTIAPDRCGDDYCEAPETETSCPVDCAVGPGGAGRVPDGYMVDGQQLTLNLDEQDNLVLSWGASCLIEDVDYGVYEGSIGDFASHTSRVCSTGGALSTVLEASAGDTYYLVVPQDLSNEGSYGTDSEGDARPQSMDACEIQSVAPCE